MPSRKTRRVIHSSKIPLLEKATNLKSQADWLDETVIENHYQ